MKVSIIIPSYNEVYDLEKCIKSLRRQSFDDFEIIIVDDGSTDKTPEVLQELRIKNYDLRIFKQNHGGAGKARNFGARYAKGEILVFVDADMTFDQDFLKNLVAPILTKKVKGTFSKDEYVENWENIWARCWNINEGWQEKSRHPKNYPNHQPVFRAILKSEFTKVRGFTPGGYDDDWSLAKKLGYEADNASNALFYHKNPSSLNEIFYHAKWVGKRKYKLGILGHFVALFRVLLPFSIILGLYKGFKNKELRFMIFKVVYDFGIFVGILEFLIKGKTAK